jgi:hypothetical protein
MKRKSQKEDCGKMEVREKNEDAAENKIMLRS